MTLVSAPAQIRMLIYTLAQVHAFERGHRGHVSKFVEGVTLVLAGLPQ